MTDYLPLADQLNILFATVRAADEREYTIQEVSNATGISIGAVSQLRTGKITNPQLNTLRALCQFFGVPLRYFDTRSAEECYALLVEDSQPEPPSLNEIAFRATHLSPHSQIDVLTIIKWVQAAEAQRAQGGELPPLPHLNPDAGDSDEHE